jgi:pimeloyl-ACP methyl ester carboxylesterase
LKFNETMHQWMIYFDLHMGVSRWRERWTDRRGGRYKGVWDANLERETIVLRDGRRLSYFLDGPLLERHALPHVFVFHALFLSGNSFLMAEAPQDYILVCVNRPGYFGSDPVGPDYSYDKFALDMEQLADRLGLDTFLVAGHSSGGPCSLACAAHLPNRVSAVGILSGDPEYAHEGVPDKRKTNACLLGCFLPCFLRRAICCLPIAKNGVRGLQNDFRLETSPYSFRTESVHQPTIIFAGEADSVLPLEVSRHVHERLRNAQLRVVPNIGHLGLLRDEVLRDFFEALLCIASEADVESPPVAEDRHEVFEMT